MSHELIFCCKNPMGKFNLDYVDLCNILGKYYESLTTGFPWPDDFSSEVATIY